MVHAPNYGGCGSWLHAVSRSGSPARRSPDDTRDGGHHSGARAVQDGVPSRARGLNHLAGTPAANMTGTYRTIGASSDSHAPFGRSPADAPVRSVNPSSSHCARINEMPHQSRLLFLLPLSLSGDAETAPDRDRWIGGGAAGYQIAS